MVPGKGGFKEQGVHCKSGCSMHLAGSLSVKRGSKHFLLHLCAASLGQCDTPSRLKANRRHVQKAAGNKARHAWWSEQTELGTLCRLGSSMINVGDTLMAVKPKGCCQAVRRK